MSKSENSKGIDLKTMGLKTTLPRLKILNLFENSQVRHLSAEDVYKELLGDGEDIGLATVYRVLTQFEQAGLLERHHFESGKAVFELASGNMIRKLKNVRQKLPRNGGLYCRIIPCHCMQTASRRIVRIVNSRDYLGNKLPCP